MLKSVPSVAIRAMFLDVVETLGSRQFAHIRAIYRAEQEGQRKEEEGEEEEEPQERQELRGR